MVATALLHELVAALRQPGIPAVVVKGLGPDDGVEILRRLSRALGRDAQIVGVPDPGVPTGGLWLTIARGLDAQEGGDPKRRVRRAVEERARAGQRTVLAVTHAERLAPEALGGLLSLAEGEPALRLLLLRSAGSAPDVAMALPDATVEIELADFAAPPIAAPRAEGAPIRRRPDGPRAGAPAGRGAKTAALVGVCVVAIVAGFYVATQPGSRLEPVLRAPEAAAGGTGTEPPALRDSARDRAPEPESAAVEPKPGPPPLPAPPVPVAAGEPATPPVPPADRIVTPRTPPLETAPTPQPAAPESTRVPPPARGTTPEPAPATAPVAAPEPAPAAPRIAATGAPIHINASPWARIEIDGAGVGETPLGDLVLTRGVHQVRAVFPDGRSQVREVRVGDTERYLSFGEAPRE